MYSKAGVALHMHCQKVLISHRIEIIKNILYFKIHKNIIKTKHINNVVFDQVFYLPHPAACQAGTACRGLRENPCLRTVNPRR